MPRDLTHVILADDMRPLMSASARRCADENRTAFHMGAVSHDSFLYGSDPKLSTRIHGGLGDDTRAVILSMMDDIRQEKDPAVRAKEQAFVYGFLSHSAVDSVFHPFVYSVSGSQVRQNNPDDKHVALAKTRHRYVETWLDMHFLKEKKLDLDTYKPFKEVMNDSGCKDTLSAFFGRNYQKAFGMDEDQTKMYKKGLYLQMFIGRVTQNQKLGRFLRRLDNFLDGGLGMVVSGFYQKDRRLPPKLKDFKEFKHPVTGETVHKNIQDLTKDALKRGAGYITAAEKYLDTGDREAFLKAVPNINLDTGVENTKLSDIKKAEPLSVEEVKGNKFLKFIKDGFKTFTSGAKSLVNGRHKEQPKYVSPSYAEHKRAAVSKKMSAKTLQELLRQQKSRR